MIMLTEASSSSACSRLPPRRVSAGAIHSEQLGGRRDR